MSIELCENSICRHSFELIEFGGDRPAPLQKRTFCCPYCGHIMQRASRGAFVTSPCEQPKITKEHHVNRQHNQR